ncbi:Metallo-dependent phosphatase-like protein [Mycena sp. CBHHK59/15]|nr:Metallo-dependent phosphatase-like protein [Mycena sp. CBHHK59/15]
MSMRQLLAFSILAFFCLYFFSSGLSTGTSNFLWHGLTATTSEQPYRAPGFPDFGRYAPPRTLSGDEFPIRSFAIDCEQLTALTPWLDDPHKRIIIVGDVHGMDKPLHALFDKLSYDPSSDVLLHVGDIIAKGPHDGSLAVIDYMAAHNVTGVRGNHDQKVIEWRAWLDWINGLDGGAPWLADFHRKWSAAAPADPEAWAEKHLRKAKTEWARRIPKGWKLLGDHYRVAAALSDAQFAYLLALPLVLHAPAAHAYIAHAGVLPSDPRYAPAHRRQPLARVPTLPKGATHDRAHPNATLPLLRRLQEAAVLTDVPQNTDPWVTLNMRGVLPDKSVTRAKNGEPWSDVWNHDVSLCAGFDQHIHLTKHSKNALPCYPATVVYGHAASRGLDVKRWTVGLDSGCVYEKRLSSLVLEPQSASFEDDNDEHDDAEAYKKKHVIPFGDSGRARIVSVKCK